jgi:hypothetical protein
MDRTESGLYANALHSRFYDFLKRIPYQLRTPLGPKLGLHLYDKHKKYLHLTMARPNRIGSFLPAGQCSIKSCGEGEGKGRCSPKSVYDVEHVKQNLETRTVQLTFWVEG